MILGHLLPRRLRLLAAGAAVALAGCGMFPTITPDMALPDPASVQFQTASGRVLSPERSKEIIARLSQGDASDMLAHHLALEQQLAGSLLSLGNRVTLLQDGPDTYAAMLAAIADAHDHIDMETYIFEDDDAGRRFADALLAKQRAGVQVNLIRDSVGTIDTPRAFFDRLKAAGIAVVEFNPVDPLRAKAGWDVNQRDHRKLLVVDGKSAVLGGINISSVYSGGSSVRIAGSRNKTKVPWRDTDLRIEGPVVAAFQKLFMDTWNDQKGPPLAQRNYFPPLVAEGHEIVRAIGSGPDQAVNLNYVTLLTAINSAEHDVLLTNAYFVPDPQLIRTLVGAAGRGVNVEMIVPSVTDSSLVFNAGRAHYEELLRGGVKIFERRQALLHSKTALIDGVWATVGSTNLDWRSFLHNQELTAVILGPEFGAKMREAFERDLAESDPITLEKWEHRSLGTRAKEWFGSLWEYWL